MDRAIVLVEALGAEGFSLRQAARLVGVSANAAYRHFAGKSALLGAVADAGFATMEQRLRTAGAAVGARRTPAAAAVERIKALGRAYVAFAVDHPQLLRLMFGSSGSPSGDPRAAPRRPAYALLGAALDELVAAGVLPADRRPGAELKAWTAVHGFASLVVQRVGALGRPAKRTAALEAVLDFALIGLCGRLPPGPRRPRRRGRRPRTPGAPPRRRLRRR